MIHILDGMERDSGRFYHVTQNSAQFKTCNLFISGIFHVIFSHYGSTRETETAESETADKEGLLYLLTCLSTSPDWELASLLYPHLSWNPCT